MANQQKYLSILFIFTLLAFTLSGCGSSNKEFSDFVPIYFDPNGGPILTIYVGADEEMPIAKKNKSNTFQSSHTESVKIFKLDGTLIGSAIKNRNANWQFQVPDNAPITIQAKVKNILGGSAFLETIVSNPTTSNIPLNTKTTEITYLTILNAYLQSQELNQITDLKQIISQSIQSYLNLEKQEHLNKQLNALSNLLANTELLDTSEIYIKKFLLEYIVYFKIKTYLAQLESGALNIAVPATTPSMFKTSMLWDPITLTSTLNTTILTREIQNIIYSKLSVSLVAGFIKVDTNPPSANSKSISLTLNANDLIELKSYFSRPNNDPIFTSTPIKTAVIGKPYSYSLTASDADGDNLTFGAKVMPTWLSLNGSILNGTPTSANLGGNNVIVTVTDSRISTAIEQSFTITVSATETTNALPVITSTPITTANEKIFYQYTLIATDSDNDPLQFSIVTKPSWLSFNNTTGVLSGTPAAKNVGDHIVTLQVTDGIHTITQSFVITVNPAQNNTPPIFVPPGELNATEGIFFSTTIQATDADNDTLTFAATKLPSWLTFNANTRVLSGTAKNSDFSNNMVTLTVTDGKITTPISLNLTININTIPTITSNPVTSVIAGTIYQYKIIASDKDGDPVSVTVPTLPAWMTYTATGTILNGAPTNTNIGIYDVSILASDNKATITGKQTFTVQVLNDLFIAKINNVEVTDKENIKFQNPIVSLSVAARNTNSNLSFQIKLDNDIIALTNNATSVNLTKASQTVEFVATDSSQKKTSIKVNLIEDEDHKVDILITGGTEKTNGTYRKIPGLITISGGFHGSVSEQIINRTILLDDIPQPLDSNNQYILNPETITAGEHSIKASISFKKSVTETLTSSTTKILTFVENSKPTQVVKVNDLAINSDINMAVHIGDSIKITTSLHTDADEDSITKGLYIDGILNTDLTSYTATLNANQTKVIKTYLKDPYDTSDAYTITLSASATNSGIPITLSATGTKLNNSLTIFRDKVNGEPNLATIKATLGVDTEGDNVSKIEWLLNSTIIPDENDDSIIVDLSTYGGASITITCKVTDDFEASPATTTSTISIPVNLDAKPTFTSAKLDSVTIGLGSSIAVDHSLNTNKTFIPFATDTEGDTFSFQYKLNNTIETGSQFLIPNTTLSGSTLTVNIIQHDTIVATDTHNITANNIVPTPIFIGNPSHVDLNGNYELIVKPGIDIEGDELNTIVTLNNTTIAGVVIGNEIHYSIDMTALGGTTAQFAATNSDGIATPVTTTFNVPIILSLAPSNLKAIRGASQVTLSWGSVNTATSYNLYYGTAINISKSSTKVANITSPYTLTGLTNGTTYYFRVTANHISGEGSLSNTDIPMTPHKAGDSLTITVNGSSFVFKYIPDGSFTMGAPSNEIGAESGELPAHTVTISNGFWMLQSEVTQAQYLAITGVNTSFNIGLINPVENLTWENIEGTNGFIDQIHTADTNTSLTSGLYMLPTEAQWEYACRAGTTTRFYWGDDINTSNIGSYAWYSGNAIGTKAVSLKSANAWGLYDMLGNVSEWCRDKTPSAYTSESVTDPQGNSIGNERIYRGGSWYDSKNNCRSAKRYSASKDIKGTNLGFRFIRIPLDTE